MNTKRAEFKMNNSNPMKEIIQDQSLAGNSGITSMVAKWVPLICAGAAVGVSIIALKEIKNARKEISTFKKEQFANQSKGSNSEVDNNLLKKIELMDEQIRKITSYIASLPVPEKQFKKDTFGNNNPINQNSNNIQEPKVKNVINKEPSPEDSSEYEYEEVEVTDDEEEN